MRDRSRPRRNHRGGGGGADTSYYSQSRSNYYGRDANRSYNGGATAHNVHRNYLHNRGDESLNYLNRTAGGTTKRQSDSSWESYNSLTTYENNYKGREYKESYFWRIILN